MNVTLQVVQGRPSGKKLVFPTGEFYFGRGVECHIRPESEWVSRQHAVLRVGKDGVTIQDLGSRNGTLVNGERITAERRLWPGDLIQIGPLVFEVYLGERQPAVASTTVARSKSAQEETAFVDTAPPPAPTRPSATVDSTESHPILPAEEPAAQG